MTRPWRCADCQQPLGVVRLDRTHRPLFKLVINDRVERVEPRFTCYIVHCPCGGTRTWRDGKIELPNKNR